jgi:phosphoglycolate phosphatase
VGDLRRLVVFDLDGTLIDSRRDLADSANALIVERGGRPLPEEAIGRMVGDGAAMLVRRALDAAGLAVDEDSVPRFLELYDARLLNHTRAYAGIPAVLAALRPHAAIAVLTNKPAAPSERILAALGLAPLIEATIGGDSTFPKKPDPASLQHLVRRFGATPRSTVMVGDSLVDYRTARAAGTAICLTRYGFGYQNVDEAALGDDVALVDDAEALRKAVTRLLGRMRQP